MLGAKFFGIAVSAAIWTTAARAAVIVSAGPTQNMSCSASACSPTSADAVLNVGDLTSMLATSDVSITSDALALDIAIETSFGWSAAHTLTLDAYRSIAFAKGLFITGPGGLSLVTNHGGGGGDYRFERKGHIHFANLSSPLVINGKPYKLVRDIAGLAASVAAKPAGRYALAGPYDASADGSYSRVPIATDFSGRFEGLGNAISNLAIYDMDDNSVGLFKAFTEKAVVRDLRLLNVNLFAENSFFQQLGGLVGFNGGRIFQCAVTGAVRSDFFTTAGGLVGINDGVIAQSFADVEVSGAEDAEVGGLVGNAHGTVTDSYAVGKVIAGDKSDVGGLVGYSWAAVKNGYSTGNVSGGQSARVGGSMGTNFASVQHVYWDTLASGTTTGIADQSGTGTVEGMTTGQLKSGLPAGFNPAVWAQTPHVNGGFPYLLGASPQ